MAKSLGNPGDQIRQSNIMLSVSPRLNPRLGDLEAGNSSENSFEMSSTIQYPIK